MPQRKRVYSMVLPRGARGPTVSFEEYIYWASITRAEEKIANDEHQKARGPKILES
jgi:hypothetical protein